jgi:hypothetical protein
MLWGEREGVAPSALSNGGDPERQGADFGMSGWRGKCAAMPARLAPLCDNRVDPCRNELSRFVYRRCCRDDFRSVGLQGAHHPGVRGAEMAGEHGHPLFEHHRDLAVELAEQVARVRNVAGLEFHMGRRQRCLQRRLMRWLGNVWFGPIDIEVDDEGFIGPRTNAGNA